MGRPKTQFVCDVEDCERDAVSRGWCSAHYNRWQTTGDVQAHVPIKERPRFAGYRICTFAGCHNRSKGPELCSGHLSQRSRGVPLKPLQQQIIGALCTFPDCGRPHTADGLCDGHYRQRRRGEELRPLRTTAPPGSGTTNKSGYRVVRGKLEHRVVMEEKLGRPMRDDETVHHINGNRQDNRPENLELWVRQPPGQRARDLLAWARDIIERYESEEDEL